MYLRNFFFLCLSLFFLTSALAQKEYQPDKLFTIDQLNADFDIFYNAFYEEHPGWGYYHPADSMQAWFEQTKAQLDRPMTEGQFRKLLYPLVAKLGCGHTRIKMPAAYYKYKKKQKKTGYINHYLPINIHKIDGKLIVTHNYLPDSTLIPPGSEVVRIDGKSAEKIIADIETMFPADGYNTTHKEKVLDAYFTTQYAFYYGQKESYDVAVRFGEGKVFDMKLAARAITSEDYDKAEKERAKKFQPKDKIVLKKKGYQLRLLENQENTALLKINRFAGKRGIRFYKKAFRYLSEKNIPNLVIDLRNNGGGSGKEALTLVSYINDEEVELFGKKKKGKPVAHKYLQAKFARRVLFPIFMPIYFKSYSEDGYLNMGFSKKPKKNNFDGKVFTLYNGMSFSSSCIVGAYLKEQGNLITIGQETGGGEVRTNAFQMPRLRLPNTNVNMVYPMFQVINDVKTKDQGRGLLPDYPIKYSWEDLLNGKDLEIEKVKEIIE